MKSTIFFDLKDLQTRYRNTAVERYAQALFLKVTEIGLPVAIMPRPLSSRFANRLLVRNFIARKSEVFVPHQPDEIAVSGNLNVLIYDFIPTEDLWSGKVRAIRNRWLYRNWAYRAKRIFFFSCHMRDTFCTRFGDKQTFTRCHVLPAFLFPEFATMLRSGEVDAFGMKSEVVPTDAPYLLALGTGEPRKNLPRVLRLYSLARKIQPDLHLVLYGYSRNPAWATALTQAIAESEVPRDCVHRTGRIDDATLSALMRKSEAFLFPSFEEGVGLPPIEALAAGTRVLISDDPVMVELLSPYSNIEILSLKQPEKDFDSLSKLLLRDINPQDAQHVLKKFDVELTARIFEQSFA